MKNKLLLLAATFLATSLLAHAATSPTLPPDGFCANAPSWLNSVLILLGLPHC